MEVFFNRSEFTDVEVLDVGGIAADTCPDCGWGRIFGWQSDIEGSLLELLNPSGDEDRCC